jgi:hypothetical protein
MSTLTEKDLEVAEFLKHQSIFQVLDMNELENLCLLFSETVCGPGHIIFSEGDTPDGLYVIKSGNVAVLKGKPHPKVIAYLTAGECFGEMAELQDTPRTATIRVPEEAIVLRLPTASLREVTRKYPLVAAKIADIISQRAAEKGNFKPPGLQGNLAFFDLPTVIQTVIASRQEGILSLFGRSGRVVGRLILKNSAIAAASFDHLHGDQALYSLINSSDPLDFTFDQVSTNDHEADAELQGRPPHMLLIEGARRADELPKLMKVTGWPSSLYMQVQMVPDLNLFGHDRRDFFRSLWSLIEMGCNTESICKQLPYDRFTVLNGLNDCLNAKWIKRIDGPKATDELRRKTGQYVKPSLEDIMAYAAMSAREKTSGAQDKPYELVKVINAFNGVSTNLGLLYGKVEVRMLLQEALAKASRTFPVLKGLRVHIDSPCLDMRCASAEFASSADSESALLLIGNHLMDLLLKMQNSP